MRSQKTSNGFLCVIAIAFSIFSSAPCQVPAVFGIASSGCCADGNSTITTIAGTGAKGYSGDGGPALSATLNYASGIVLDPNGNLYFTDTGNNVVRKITPGGVISTVAGTGTVGFSGDGGQAGSAQLHYPYGLLLDAAGNLYICDALNNRIRKINASGIISTFAGNGVAGYSGDGGPALGASFNFPGFIAMDGAGNIVVADISNHVIRKISPSGIITTIAGTGTAGFSGDGGPATSALIWGPEGVAVDPSGNIYFYDDFNVRVRKIDASGIITSVAGTGTGGHTGDGGPAVSAELGDIHGIAFCGGRIYLAELDGYIRMIDPCGVISTIAGKGNNTDIGDGGPASAADLYAPADMVFDGSGDLYVGEGNGNRIRKIAFNCAPTLTPGCNTSPTSTYTATATMTFTASPTVTPTFTRTFTPAATASFTNSATPTMTFTATSTATPVCVIHAWPDPYDHGFAVGGFFNVGCISLGSTVSFYTVSGELVGQASEKGGMAQWNALNTRGCPISPGIYFYVVQNGTSVIGEGKFLVKR